MSDRDFAPLSAACVRALNDKLYEKRKGAALEIEKYVDPTCTCPEWEGRFCSKSETFSLTL